MFSCEFCEIFKNNFFTEHLRATASGNTSRITVEVFLKTSQNSRENTCVRVYFFSWAQSCNFVKKETLARVFSWEFCEIFQKTFSTENLWTTASRLMWYCHSKKPPFLLYVVQIPLARRWKLPVTHFTPPVSFYTPWKHYKTRDFLIILGGK